MIQRIRSDRRKEQLVEKNKGEKNGDNGVKKCDEGGDGWMNGSGWIR